MSAVPPIVAFFFFFSRCGLPWLFSGYRDLLRDECAASLPFGRLSLLCPAIHHCPTCTLRRSPRSAGTWLHLLASMVSMAPTHPRRQRLVTSCHCVMTRCSCCFLCSPLLRTDVAAWRSLLLLFLQHALSLTHSPPPCSLHSWVTPGAVLAHASFPNLVLQNGGFLSSCTALVLHGVGLFRFSPEKLRVSSLTALCAELVVRLPQAASLRNRARSA